MTSLSAQVLADLQRAIRRQDKPNNRIDYQRFHKQPLEHPVGLRTPVLRAVSSEVFSDLKRLPVADLLNICDDLLASGRRYMLFFAFDFADRSKRRLSKSDFSRLERWLKTYVADWGSCDHLCCGPLGFLLFQHEELSPRAYRWTDLTRWWLRRAAAVSLIVAVRNGTLIEEVFKTAGKLLNDPEDLVQKGYGWMLKEATRKFPSEVFDWVLARRKSMPRTALRYAVEKLPPAMKRRAMAK